MQIKKFPCTNPMGIRECCPLFQCRGWGTRSDGIAPDRENECPSPSHHFKAPKKGVKHAEC